jgi:hypothetical protein
MTVIEARELYGDDVVEGILRTIADHSESHLEFLRQFYSPENDPDALDLPEGWEGYVEEAKLDAAREAACD